MCNESLAFTCFTHRIHTHANYNDSILTAQITKYADLVEYKDFYNPITHKKPGWKERKKPRKDEEIEVEGKEEKIGEKKEKSKGGGEKEDSKEGLYLWGTNPPKILNDLTESLVGAIHVDSGELFFFFFFFFEGVYFFVCFIS